MLCKACNKNQATIHYKSNINGKVVEKYLCSECAEKEGIHTKSAFEPIDMMDGFFGKNTDDIFGGLFAGMMNTPSSKSVSEPKVCSLCGMRYSEFLHAGKIGCAECYKTFSSSLGSTIKRIHGNVAHCGKVPEGKKNEISDRRKIEQLKAKLSEAIEKQEYEMAAKYRDEIKEIENKKGDDK